MEIRTAIERFIRKRKPFKASEIVRATGYSRAYVHRVLKEFIAEGRIVLMGKADRARYVVADNRIVQQVRSAEKKFHRVLKNSRLSEDRVLEEIKRTTGIFDGLRPSLTRILDYGFTEMLNNAIEHSRSETIDVTMERLQDAVRFSVTDQGIGIFANIQQQYGFHSEFEAIQQLLKGKQTTAPASHSGEGIFFTSKVADLLSFRSGHKNLIFDNRIEDVFIKEIRQKIGTAVQFEVGLQTQRSLEDVFRRYSGDEYEFGTTDISVKLFQEGAHYVSRSQARRLLLGIEQFRTVILDFRGVETIGQAFADEVFRVWKHHHPEIAIEVRNANENVQFMIRHVSSTGGDNLETT